MTYTPRQRRTEDEVNRFVDGRNEKNCVTCRQWLPRADFAKRGLYLQAKCKPCMKVYIRDYRRRERHGT